MRTANVKVGKRDGRETYLVMRFGTELEANLVWRGVNTLVGTGQIDRRGCVVVCFCEQHHAVELLFQLATGTDHDAQIQAIVDHCRERLDLNIQLREMRWQDYEPHAFVVRMAKSQDN